MQSLYKLCNMAYWLGLVAWLSVLVSSGIAAANTFAVLRDMDISITKYLEFVPDESIFPNSHSNIAAGQVLEPIFFITNAVQFIAIPIVLLTLIIQLVFFRMNRNKISNSIRTICIIIASCLFAFHSFAVAPSMNRDLRAYWQSAENGDIQAALSHRDGFLSLHPTAKTILSSTLLLVLIATAASAATMTPLISPLTASNLQTPRLAGNR